MWFACSTYKILMCAHGLDYFFYGDVFIKKLGDQYVQGTQC